MAQAENDKEEKITLTALNIPLQIFIIFLVRNQSNFTVTDIQKQFEEKHKIVLVYSRVKQILDDLCLSGNLNKEVKPFGKKNKETSFYTFKKLM